MATPNLTPQTRPAQTPQSAQLAQANSVKTLLESQKNSIAARLPKHLTADRILKVALTAINKTPKLLECTRETLLQSIMTAAELGLEPGGSLGEGYLVPYGRQCQFILGYRGMISLARRSGQIVSIEAHVVRQKDQFSCSLGLDPDLKHVPAWDELDPGPMRFVYAVAKLKDGGVQFEVMSRAQVDQIRARSKSANSGPWVTDYEAMAKKTVIRSLFKYLPVSVELATAIDHDSQDDRPAQAPAPSFAHIEYAPLEGELIQEQEQEQAQAQAIAPPVPAQAPDEYHEYTGDIELADSPEYQQQETTAEAPPQKQSRADMMRGKLKA